MKDLARVRNIGISAHIDSGKTTLTERILFYTKRIHKVHEVRGKDGVGATMDSMELERERGITIASAATYCSWNDHHVNIIDTPGHVDFTIEVERALRVLDGAVLVLCSVAGVQSQSITVDRQMKRYNVPRIAFVNKCDRSGANPARVCDQLRDKLGHNSVMMQIPIGLEADHKGVVDLVKMKGFLFEGDNGEEIKEIEIPGALQAEAEARREVLLDTISMYHDGLMEAMLEDNVTEALIKEAVRKATISRDITPVFLGSAYKNKGVQLLLNAVIEYLPNPMDVTNDAIRMKGDEEETFRVETDPTLPLLSLAFKLEVSPYGQLTYLRIYQGSLKKGDTIVNQRSRDKVKVGRLVRMHADSMEDIDGTICGDIVAMFGVDCASGDTFTDGKVDASMTSIHVPAPVVSLAIKPKSQKAQDNMSKALQRFSKEDPTFRVGSDEETGDTLISGMGELHLDVYVERMKREYNAEVEVGAPKVAYRETITIPADFDYTHKKQTGGSGQYGRIIGTLEPSGSDDFVYENKVTGGNIPSEYISSVEKGFKSCLDRGEYAGYPLVGLKVVLKDGNSHAVDSSDNAFQAAARGAFRAFYDKAKPVVLEPIMRVSVEGPTEFQGDMMGTVMKRRGVIQGTTEEGGFVRIDADVPLSEMFGYATVLRSATQGKAEFTMEFNRYGVAPAEVNETLRKAWLEKRAAATK
ncbi:MAG: elongation factor G [Candidatus Eisenbacteria bacterium]|uniref:Elongation factor G n=1 Tax=Eiseniibacteriota bacterium TaxID=2212470 RepID=A0A956NDG6_UNCEI|nr:elongation factor G [Candidatus Eisenbacteria bacterium]MCB9463910.1 elongation factor G [Candidatus Eisenbacteria bacterium]